MAEPARKMEPTAEAHRVVNGVDVSALHETIKTIKGQPKLAEFKFRNQNKWIEGGYSKSVIKSFYGAGKEDTNRSVTFELEADEPKILLGHDHAANPVEHLLHSLCSCMTASIVYHSAAKNIEIESLESSLEGDINLCGFLGLDENVKKGYEKIRANFDVKTNASEEQLQECVAYSPVYNMLRETVDVEVKFNIHKP